MLGAKHFKNNLRSKRQDSLILATDCIPHTIRSCQGFPLVVFVVFCTLSFQARFDFRLLKLHLKCSELSQGWNFAFFSLFFQLLLDGSISQFDFGRHLIWLILVWNYGARAPLCVKASNFGTILDLNQCWANIFDEGDFGNRERIHPAQI